ncbi:FABP family protein [Propionimicrobium sp. PCR01-08-3]|uniref:FABP family protein n=1 Tax=Propionimicrobium sp. PCR01-08-3 TaxID=3052086 RepID=UPI00255C6AE3|nr:FABP family protein [Propionimicrobium sp. PCR01-08-3]WIY82002.1 FABP family protein [Propionimicrobium sp. PCR01-08-3]
MAFEINPDLNEALMPLAWLIGSWQGNGHGTWPGVGDFEFGQQIDFATNQSPYLHYLSQTWTLDADGQPDKPLTMETGFWRPVGTGEVEVVLSSPEGWSEVWAGSVTGAKIELTTDVVMRTTTAEVPYTGGHRLYGNVEGDLLWAFDRATTDVELQPYMWARLARS